MLISVYVYGIILLYYVVVLLYVNSNTYRVTSEEKRAMDRSNEILYNEVREAAEVHRQVRADFQKWVRPGLSMIEIAQYDISIHN
jgi:hypothetical protein